jgi:hypothetical protein
MSHTSELTMREAVLSVDDIRKLKIPKRKSLLDPWLKEDSINLISGFRGIGKSWFIHSSLITVASEDAELGPWESPESVRCILVDGEMATSDDKERFNMFQIQRGIPLYILNDAYAHTLGLPKANLNNPKWRKEFKEMLLDMDIKLACFDNLSSLAPGYDENDKFEYDPVNQFLLELRFEGISSILAHHDGKKGDQRGSSAKEDNLDISIQLIKPKDYKQQDGCRFVTRFTKHRLPQVDLPLIADTEFRLVQNGKGYEWQWKGVAKDSRKEGLRLLAQGMEQSMIAKMLGVAKGTVSKWKTSFIDKKLLTDKGKLTQAGNVYLGGEYE